MAFQIALSLAEKFMREATKEGELATVIVEDNADHRQLLRISQQLMQSRRLSADLSPDSPLRNYVPFERIVEEAHFVGKQGSPILQVVDACAFVACRFFRGTGDVDDLFDLIRPHIVLARPGEPSDSIIYQSPLSACFCLSGGRNCPEAEVCRRVERGGAGKPRGDKIRSAQPTVSKHR